MKSKITRGSCFIGCVSYVLRTKASPEIIGGNLGGMTPTALARELQSAANLRLETQKPVWHGSLALPAGDWLMSDKWSEVAQDYLTRLGFNLDNTPYFIVRHGNTKYDHIHIVTSRVNFSRELYLGRNENLKATKLTQELERRHGLTITTGPEKRVLKKALSSQELEMAERTGRAPPRQRLQDAIDRHTQDQPTVEELIQRLKVEGITAKANIANTGKMNGFSFQIDGVNFKASQLGKNYAWQGLQARGVETATDRSAKLARRRNAIETLISTGNIHTEHDSETVTRYFLGKEVQKLTLKPEILPTEQIEQYINQLDYESLKLERLKLRKINQIDKSRGPRTRSL